MSFSFETLFRRSLTLIPATFLLASCGVVHLYDPVKEQTAKEAEAAYEQITVTDVVAARERNFDKLEEDYVAANHEAVDRLRDLFFIDAALDARPFRESLIQKPGGPIESARASFGLQNHVELMRLKSVFNELALSKARREKLGNELKQLIGENPLPCLTEMALPPEVPSFYLDDASDAQSAEIREAYNLYRKACFTESLWSYDSGPRLLGEIPTLKLISEPMSCHSSRTEPDVLLDKHGNFITGVACPPEFTVTPKTKREDMPVQVGAAIDLIEAKGEAATAYESALEARAKYAAAKKAYEAALSSQRSDKKAAETLEKRAQDLKDALNGLESVAGFFGIETAAKERLGAIKVLTDSILTSDQEGQSGPADPKLQRFIVIASSIGSLARELQAAGEAAEAFQLSALETQRQIEEAKKIAAESILAADQRRIDLRFEQIRSFDHQLGYLRRANGKLCYLAKAARRQRSGQSEPEITEWFANPGSCDDDFVAPNWSGPPADPMGSLSIDDVLGTSGKTALYPSIQREFYSSLNLLALTRSVGEATQAEIAIRLNLQKREGPLANSVASVAMWDALISGPLKQIAGYHQTGIKPEVIADLLIKAAGFGGLAIQVGE